jgi:hypothetical protein
MGQAATLPFLASGVVLVGWGSAGLYLLAAGILLSYLVAMGNAWCYSSRYSARRPSPGASESAGVVVLIDTHSSASASVSLKSMWK